MKFKGLILLILAFALMVSLCACASCAHVDENGDYICDKCEKELSKPEIKDVNLIEDGEANFQIVLGEGSGSDLRRIANQLKATLKKMDITIDIVDYNEENKRAVLAAIEKERNSHE